MAGENAQAGQMEYHFAAEGLKSVSSSGNRPLSESVPSLQKGKLRWYRALSSLDGRLFFWTGRRKYGLQRHSSHAENLI